MIESPLCYQMNTERRFYNTLLISEDDELPRLKILLILICFYKNLMKKGYPDKTILIDIEELLAAKDNFDYWEVLSFLGFSGYLKRYGALYGFSERVLSFEEVLDFVPVRDLATLSNEYDNYCDDFSSLESSNFYFYDFLYLDILTELEKWNLSPDHERRFKELKLLTNFIHYHANSSIINMDAYSENDTFHIVGMYEHGNVTCLGKETKYIVAIKDEFADCSCPYELIALYSLTKFTHLFNDFICDFIHRNDTVSLSLLRPFLQKIHVQLKKARQHISSN